MKGSMVAVMSRANKLVTRTLLGIFILLSLLMAALAIFIYTFDANRLRPWVNDKVTQAIGRPFAINGDLKISWLQHEGGESSWRAWVPWPHFSASQIMIGNPDWAMQKPFATLDEVHFDIEAWPLLDHRIVIPSITLSNPAADFERLKDGRNNWTFQLKPQQQPSAWQLDLHDIAFNTGKVSYTDEMKRAKLNVEINSLGKPLALSDVVKQQEAVARQQSSSLVGLNGTAKLARQVTSSQSGHAATSTQDYQLGWKLKGAYNGIAMAGDGKVGSVLALQDSNMAFPIHANLTFSNKTHIALVGTLTDPVHLAALDLRLWLSGQSMSHLYPLIGLALPDTPPYATDGHLSGQLKAGSNQFKYEHFSGRVGGSDLSGSLSYQERLPRPQLSGTLESKLLRLEDLGPLIGADSNASKLKRGDTKLQPAGKALPVETFRTERWKAMDADVQFTGKQILRKASLPVQNLHTHLLLKDGVLRLEPLNFGVAGGTLTSNIMLDGSRTPLHGKVNLSARRMELRRLFPSFQVMRTSFGELGGDAVLAATGNSVASLMASSNGEVKVLMGQGQISGTLLEEAGLNIANIVLYKLFGDKNVKINCAASDFIVTNGVLDSHLFAVDTDDALITMDGKINLATEQMNLAVHPQAKGLRLLSLRSPLYVRGTFKQPDVGVNMSVVLLKGAAAVGLGLIAAPLAALVPLTALSPSQQAPCQQMLAQMRQPPKVAPHKRSQSLRKPAVASR